MLYLNLTDFSTASKRLNLNNVAEVERKESLFSLPKCSNVSKKTLRKSSAKKACFFCRNAATSRRKRCGSRAQSRTCSSYAEMQQRLEETPYKQCTVSRPNGSNNVYCAVR